MTIAVEWFDLCVKAQKRLGILADSEENRAFVLAEMHNIAIQEAAHAKAVHGHAGQIQEGRNERQGSQSQGGENS